MQQHQRQQSQQQWKAQHRQQQWKAQHRQQVRQYQQQRQQQRQQRRLRQQTQTQLQTKSPQQIYLDRATNVTFGVTASERHRTIGWLVLIAGIVGAAINISGDQDYWWLFWVVFWLGLLPVSLYSLSGRNELALDFTNDTYTLQTGYYPSIETVQGPLSEITALQIDRERVKDGYVFRTRFLFREDLYHPPFRIDTLPSTLSSFSTGDTMDTALDIARRLNIPVYDDAEWGHPQSLYKTDPQRIIIQPGGTHPARKNP